MTEIVDNFGRKHNYLRISLTDRCNLRCFYCMPEGGIELTPKPNIMSYEEIIAISKAFVELGVDTIRLTGGEPLIRKDFELLLRALASLKVNLKITTNGVLLDKFFDLFQEVGLKTINISLDSLDKANTIFITKRDYYDRIMSNISMALSRGFQVKLNVVLIKGVNDHEIGAFLRMTKYQGLTIKFIEFMPFKGNKWDWNKGVSEDEILEQVQSEFGEVIKLINPVHSTSNNYQVLNHAGSFGVVSTITKPFCSECNRIRLTTDGKMKNCLFATSETDLLSLHREGVDLKLPILLAIKGKKYSRDGMREFDPSHYEQNRSMTAIGG